MRGGEEPPADKFKPAKSLDKLPEEFVLDAGPNPGGALTVIFRSSLSLSHTKFCLLLSFARKLYYFFINTYQTDRQDRRQERGPQRQVSLRM